MSKNQDYTLYIPAEYLDSLNKIISTGIKESDIDDEIKAQLKEWWQVERQIITEFDDIYDEINDME